MQTPKHILWIYCDELRADVLGAYGGPAGLTPNLDGLAADGTVFTRAYCNSPVCVPSRTAALTGLPPWETGVYHNEAVWPVFEWGQRPRCWLEDLADAGWRTVNVGKVHQPLGPGVFQEHHSEGGGMVEFREQATPEEMELISPAKVQTAIGGRWPADRPFPPEEVTRNACDVLTGADDRPLFLRVGYMQPHTPVVPPEALLKMWSTLDLPEPDTAPPLNRFEAQFAENLGSVSAENTRKARTAYHALVHWVDLQVGELLAALDTSGNREDTLICFTSDHGASLGERGLWAKQVFSPGSHRVPMILSGPGVGSGRVEEGLTQSLDFGPTFLGAAGVASSVNLPGRDLLSGSPPPEQVVSAIGYGVEWSRQMPNLTSGPWTEGRGWPRRACLRTSRWRYERNVRLDGEMIGPDHPEADVTLVDCACDPNECRNVDGEHPEEVVDLEQRLAETLHNGREPLDLNPPPWID